MKKGQGTALITGASAGIGAALASEFARNGHDLILVARSKGKLKTLAAKLKKEYGVGAEVLPCDLSLPDAAETLRDALKESGLQVDILVNNAGLLTRGPFLRGRLKDHEQLVQVNITALVALTHLLAPAMVKRKFGRILNVASTSSFQPVPQLATYAASKAFVLSFSEALNIELKGSGVRVTSLCPGFTETDMITREGAKDMKLPFVRNMTAQEVAAQGYDACCRGTPLYINGASNRALVTFGKHQPRWLQRRLAALVGRKSIADHGAG